MSIVMCAMATLVAVQFSPVPGIFLASELLVAPEDVDDSKGVGVDFCSWSAFPFTKSAFLSNFKPCSEIFTRFSITRQGFTRMDTGDWEDWDSGCGGVWGFGFDGGGA
jgi:hypothetical protein